MAATLQKLIRRSQPTRIIAALHTSPSPNPSVSSIFGRPHHIEVKPEPQLCTNLSSFLNEHKNDDFPPSQLRKIYPSFPLGFCLNPIPVCGSISSEAAEDNDSGKVWADSVKKKRKRKMNKHKYRKLRKRLRRLT